MGERCMRVEAIRCFPDEVSTPSSGFPRKQRSFEEGAVTAQCLPAASGTMPPDVRERRLDLRRYGAQSLPCRNASNT